jgi:nuclear migration protein JNM1
VDARDVDFSDRIAGKRKSYIVSSRRRRRRRGAGRRGDGYYGSDDSEGSEEEEGEVETVERRLARLRREVEEVKVELEGKDLGGIRELADALEELQGGEGARGRLVRRVAAGLAVAPKKEAREVEPEPEPEPEGEAV